MVYSLVVSYLMAEETPQSLPQISLSVLQVIRPAQAQNGLKHGDYQRYRKFCRKRLESLYKSLKLTHGKGRYQKRKLEASNVTDPRHLQIPLVSAERAWAYAMELKKDMSNKVDLRMRRHLIRRLAKAATWAAELVALSRERCDARSSLEAEAYSSWMEGNVLLEKESDWEKALGQFLKARKLFEELSKVGEIEQQTYCAQMLEEIEPSVRYCNYQISRAGGQVPDVAGLLALGEQGPGRDMLQSQLAALAEQAAAAQASTTSAYMEWQGRKCVVRPERVRLCLHQAGELAAQLEGAMDDDVMDERLALHDRRINAYNEAKSHIRSALQGATGGEGGAQLEELQSLDLAVSGTVLERTIERGEMMARAAAGRYTAALQRATQGRKLKDRERNSRPEDVVRLYDNLQRHAEELGELAQRLGGRQGEALIEGCAAKVARYQAWRCLFMAHTYLAGGKLAEAHALFQRAAERATAAAAKEQELSAPDVGAVAELQQMVAAANGYRLVAQVEAAVEADVAKQEAVEGVDKLTLVEAVPEAGAAARPPFLMDDINNFESFAGQGGKDVRLYEVPYPLQPIAVRPIMLDTAFSAIKYPSLEHRVKKAEKKSLLGRLFGY